MRQRLMTLKRLGAMYELVEEIHSGEARLAASEVGEAEAAIHNEIDRSILARRGERLAIEREDYMGRSTMEAQEEMAVRRKRQLEPVLDRRRKISEMARAQHMASRLWNERMKSLIEDEVERITILEERRLQALTDDRFLAHNRYGMKKRGEPR